LWHQLPPGRGPVSPDGNVLAINGKQGRLSFWDTETGELLASQLLRLEQPRDSMFHPGGALDTGSTNPHWEAGLLPGGSIGFGKIETGKLQAELLTFEEGKEWLIRTTGGQLSGSDAGLARVAWRASQTANVELRPEFTRSRVAPEEVGRVLSQSLAAGTSIRESLQDSPQVLSPSSTTRR
jgi:hypothetical protein